MERPAPVLREVLTVAEMAAAAMRETPVLVAPAVPFGFTPHHLGWPGTISLRLDTYLAMLADIARSIIEAGFPRAIFVNGHGGNSAPLRSLVGELVTDGVPVGMVDYFAPGAQALAETLTVGLKGGGSMLLALLILPLYIPVLILGTGTMDAALQGLPVQGYLLWMSCLGVLALSLSPLAIAAGLRNFRHKVEKGRKQYVRHEKHKRSSVDETDMRD